MKVFLAIVLGWFLVTLLILPHFGQWDFDIWTTNDYDEILTALETPVTVLTSLGEVVEDIQIGWGQITENETVQTVWDFFKNFSPAYWIYDWITGWFGGGS